MTKFLNISTDRTLGGSTPSDSTVSSQKAIKNYIADNVPLNKATGSDSVSLFGIGSTSDYDLNIGYGSSSGGEAVALGYSATARSVSVAIGSRSGNTGNKTNYVAIGYYAIVEESNTVAIGYASKAYAQYSIAIGDTSYAQQYATYGIAIGYNSNCTGSNSVALGYNTTADAYGTALGAGANVSGVGAIQLGYGSNSEHQSLYVGFNAATSQYRVNYKLLGSTGIIPIERLGGDNTSTADKFLKENGSWSTIPGGWTPPSQTGNAGKFLTTDGTDTSWGIPKSFNLFDSKWSDYILNDQSWLRADTFSWQDGAVYSDAYNHLVADYQGGTSQTETVGSYTITYVLATDGHKITTDETTVDNIYDESGVAWYYVLDTTNQRFKLPRSSHGNLVEKYQNGSNWYRVYSDGWCEQGGVVSLNECSTVVVNYSKVFANTNYSLSAIQTNLSTATDTEVGIQFTPTSASQGTLSCHYINPNTTTVSWKVCGYLAIVPENSQYKYLYFYVGEFSQSATEQTAGLNSSLFNGKADIDAGNFSSSGKETIVGFSAIDYDSKTNVSSSPYTATKDGLFVLQSDGSDDMTIWVNGNTIQHIYYSQIIDLLFSVPVGKGDVITYVAQGRGTQAAFFYPVKGE